MKDKSAYTPMMRQYLEIKENYQDAFVFFRLGDFYELFFEDATLASKELEIALTGREAGSAGRIPMCGVPHHAADGYIDKLISKGYKVALCEQVEDAKDAKTMVKREVVNVITPGTVIRQNALNEKENNYLITIEVDSEGYVLAYSDLSTGECFVKRLPTTELISQLVSLDCREILVGADFDQDILHRLQQLKQIVISVEENKNIPIEYEILIENITDQVMRSAFGRLINYIIRTQKSSLNHLQEVKISNSDDYLKIDYNSRINLELVSTLRKKSRQGSLLWLLDKTKTAMGSRLLKRWIENPLTDKEQINERLDNVVLFNSHFMAFEEFRRKIDDVYDLERLVGRVSAGSANARDLMYLKVSLEKIPELEEILNSISPAMLEGQCFSKCEEIVEVLESSIAMDAPLSTKEGNIIKDGFNAQLDEYRYVIKHGKDWILDLEKRERERSGIRSLKIKYNKVFGYYIEITKSNLDMVRDDLGYVRKQTLTNCERFVTEELKEKEDIILNAHDLSVALEYELFVEVRAKVAVEIMKIQQNARTIAYFDVLQSFALVSTENNYVRPEFALNGEINIVDGRHPVIEQVLGSEPYVENDCVMPGDLSVFLITGPNMAGKSTYMRQMALIAVMAQIGSFVPATSATLPIFDQIFTRIGAGDDLTSGHSTFMVEMMETNYALKNATKDSLILLDEIGRGTATFDGMALAQGIIEYIYEHIGAKTLFSTHYHELTELENTCPGLKNLHVKAKEHDGNLIFLHKVTEGASDKSYGIHVANIAEMPKFVTSRAKELLAKFEERKVLVPDEQVNAERRDNKEPLVSEVNEESQKYQGVIDKLKEVDVYALNPMQAMNVLYEVKEKLK